MTTTAGFKAKAGPPDMDITEWPVYISDTYHVSHGGKTLEGVGAHYVRGSYWTLPGGFVGYADWRGQYGTGRRGCGHAHGSEDAALACMTGILAAHDRGEHNFEPRCIRCDGDA